MVVMVGRPFDEKPWRGEVNVNKKGKVYENISRIDQNNEDKSKDLF